MAGFRTLDHVGDIEGKRALVRVDLNVPMADGKVTDATRIERVAPTILELADKGAKVILLAHSAAPRADPSMRSLVAMPPRIIGQGRLHCRELRQAGRGRRGRHEPGDIALMENRFHKEEERMTRLFAKALRMATSRQ